MIQTKHLCKTYPNQISPLSDVSIEIPPKEFAYIFGPSGSGKTTLLRILCCEERPSGGEVRVNGIQITKKGFRKIHRVRRAMGVVFQNFRLLRDRTVAENIAFVLEVTGHPRREIKGRVTELLAWVGLLGREIDPVYALSAGEQQRLAIARALVNDPPILLADEPTGNLDPQMTREVMRIFAYLHERGTTIVLATHDDRLIREYPYRVLSLAKMKAHIVTEQKEAAAAQ